jgi:large subunit ribosomal protein L22
VEQVEYAEARAIARYVRVSTRKVNQVLALIRGLPVDEAQVVLQFTQKPIARKVSKILKSAVNNLTQQHEDVAVESLYVKEAVAGPAPSIKKIMPRARGRASRILRRFAHITIVVREGEAPEQKKRSRKAGK